MNQDPIDVAEKLHDLDNAKRLAEQDRLEAEFKRDPDWDLVGEYLIKRETVGDLCSLLWDPWYTRLDMHSVERAQTMISLAIEQCAREYAQKAAGK